MTHNFFAFGKGSQSELRDQTQADYESGPKTEWKGLQLHMTAAELADDVGDSSCTRVV